MRLLRFPPTGGSLAMTSTITLSLRGGIPRLRDDDEAIPANY